MKRYILLFIALMFLLALNCNSQQTEIFPALLTSHGGLSDKTKELSFSFSQLWPPVYCQSNVLTLLKKKKESSNNRRFTFTANYSSNSWNDPDLDCGWSKLGRLSFKDQEKGGWNKYKLHVGWRSAENEGDLLFSLYFHDQDDNKWVSHRFSEGSVSTDIRVDMFLGVDVLGLIINNKSIGIRYKDYFYNNMGTSALSRTFFYGGSCCPPNIFMTVDFSNQLYDYEGFQTAFNNQDYVTWNLSEFESGDKGKFYSKIETIGSVQNPSDVQPATIDKQKCIIKAGADITFGSKEKVILYPGFHAKPGSHFVAAICDKIAISSIPVNFTYTQCYTVQNANSGKAKLYYKDDTSFDWIPMGSANGEILGNQICFYFSKGEVLPPGGQYKVVATFKNKCMDKTSTETYTVWKNGETIIEDSLSNPQLTNNFLGNKDILDEPSYGISIFPIPANNSLSIKLSDNSMGQIDHVIFYDNYGKEVSSYSSIHSKSLTADISNYPSGFYHVQVVVGGKVFTEKVVVE